MKIVLIPCPIAENTSTEVLSPQILAALKQTTHFLVENVRTARRFISELKLGIQIEDLIFEILDKDSQPKTVTDFYKKYAAVAYIGVISEAGCPGVADPGALAVSIAQQQGIEVVPLVGPSSILLGLMGSGFSGQSFAFIGYLPVPADARAARIRELEATSRRLGQTQLAIETPYRNAALAAALIAQLQPATRLAITCGLTLPGGWCRTLTVERWRRTPPVFEDDQPAVFAWRA